MRPHDWSGFAALGAVSWLTMARIVRGQVMSLKNQEFVLAARAGGVSTPKIIFRHLVPNALGPVIVYATLIIPQLGRAVEALSLRLHDAEVQVGLRERGPHARLQRGPVRELAAGERLTEPLALAQRFGEIGEYSPGERNVSRFDRDAGAPGELPDDRQQRVGGQRGRFVDFRPDDLPWSARHYSVASLWRCAWHSIVTATGSDVM